MAKKNVNAMDVKITADTIIITLPILKPLKESKSGKSLVVATTHGNIATSATLQNKPVVIGVNAYIKAD